MRFDPKVRNPRSLRSTLIEPFKQVKMGVYILALSTAFMVIFGVLIGSGIWQQYQQVMQIFNVVGNEAQAELVQNDVTYSFIVKLIVAALAYVASLMWIVFKLTHRIYGPLVSINRFVESITNGDYHARVTIRDKDELVELADNLNKMASKLQDRHHMGRPDRRVSENSEPGLKIVPTHDAS